MQYEPAYYIGKYRKHIFVGVIGVVVLVTGITIYAQWNQRQQRVGKLPVPIEVVPRDATITLSTGRPLASRGTTWIEPGDYKVTVEREGFASETRPLRVSEDAKPYVYIGLAGESSEAKEWEGKHKREYQRIELLTVEKAREYNVLFKSNNPIVSILPIKDPYYTIDYKNHDDTSIELLIYGTSPRYRQAAVEFLRSKGYEPTDYLVTYQGFENPLGESDE